MTMVKIRRSQQLDNLTGELQPISVTPKRSKSLINLTQVAMPCTKELSRKNLKHLHQLEPILVWAMISAIFQEALSVD